VIEEDLATRVRRLELIELAKVACANYGRVVDRKDVEELGRRVFTSDVVLRTPRDEYRGVDAVLAFYAGAFAAEPGTRRHFLANQIAEVVGAEQVLVDSYFFFVSADARSVIGWGAYRDVVVVRDREARIAEKEITLDVHTDLVAGWAVKVSSPEAS
jgi:SnoaL-like domain